MLLGLNLGQLGISLVISKVSDTIWHVLSTPNAVQLRISELLSLSFFIYQKLGQQYG